MFNYLENKDIDYVFDLVKKYYAHIEEVPDFRSYIDGVSRFIGVLEGVKSDEFYPTIQELKQKVTDFFREIIFDYATFDL